MDADQGLRDVMNANVLRCGFSHLKIHHEFERTRLRGFSSVRDEFDPAAIVQNLQTLALRTTCSITTPIIVRPGSGCRIGIQTKKPTR